MLNEKDFDFRHDLAIDPSMLDEEWLEHPVKYLNYCNLQTDAQLERDKAKERLEVVKSQMDFKVRNNPGKYDLPTDKKPTETQISAAVYLSLEYQNANEELTELNYEYNMISNAVKAFDHRKKALENYVTLYVTQFVSGPKQPKVLKEGKRMIEQIRKQVAQSQRERLNRNKETPTDDKGEEPAKKRTRRSPRK